MQQITVEDIVNEMQSKYIKTIAFRIVGSNHIDDVIQEATIQAWKHMDEFRSESPLRPYLSSIIRNISINYIRTKNYRMNTLRKDEDIQTCENEHRIKSQWIIDYHLDDELHNRSIQQLVNDALVNAISQLSNSEKYLLLQRFEKNRILSSIARELDVHTSTVMRKIESISKKIRCSMKLSLIDKNLSEDVVDECLNNMTNIQLNLIDILKKGMDS